MKRKNVVLFITILLLGLNILGIDTSTKASGNIRIFVNNEEVLFERKPILAEESIVVVSLEDFGRAINANVVYDGEGKTFAIGYGNTAFMANAIETEAFVAEDYVYENWQTVQLSIPAFFSKSEGNIFIPLQDVSTSLGIETNFDMSTNIVYLTCNQNGGNIMTAETLLNMDLVYYLNQNNSGGYDIPSDDFREFFEQRVDWIDNTVMGLSDIWAGVTDMLSGMTNAENIMRDSMDAMLSSVPDNDVVVVDHEIYDLMKSGLDATKTIVDYIFKENIDTLEICPELEPIKDMLSDPGNVYDTASLMTDVAVYSIDMLAILLSDYSKNIGYIDTLEEVLSDSGCLDSDVAGVLEVLKTEYTNKFFQMLEETRDKIAVYSVSTIANIATGNVFSIGNFTWDVIVKATGVKDKGGALKTFYGLYVINGALDRAYNNQYQKVMGGNLNEDELKKMKRLDDLERAVKKMCYECIKTVTNDKETRGYCKRQAEKYSEGCIRWKKSLVVASKPEKNGTNNGSSEENGSREILSNEVMYASVLQQYQEAVNHHLYSEELWNISHDDGEEYDAFLKTKGKFLDRSVFEVALMGYAEYRPYEYANNASAEKYIISYAFSDLNDDGIEELFIGSGNGDEGIMVRNIFSYNGENPVPIFAINSIGWRAGLCVYSDNSFLYSDPKGIENNLYCLLKGTDGPDLIKQYMRNNGTYIYECYDSKHNLIETVSYDGFRTWKDTQVQKIFQWNEFLNTDNSTDLNKYSVVEGDFTWEEAECYCTENGGHLLTINSVEEQENIEKLITGRLNESFWLGAEKVDGEWKWITGESFDYQNWDEGEPNNNEDGMKLQIYEKNGLWDDTWNEGDRGGGIKTQGLICEWEE